MAKIARTGSYEHDGLYLYNPAIAPDDEVAGGSGERMCWAASGPVWLHL